MFRLANGTSTIIYQNKKDGCISFKQNIPALKYYY